MSVAIINIIEVANPKHTGRLCLEWTSKQFNLWIIFLTSIQNIFLLYAYKYSENDLEKTMAKWWLLGWWKDSSQRELWSVMLFFKVLCIPSVNKIKVLKNKIENKFRQNIILVNVFTSIVDFKITCKKFTFILVNCPNEV